MRKINKKRQILAATLVIALAAAVTVNWYYSRSVPQTSEPGGAGTSVEGMLGDSMLVAGTAANQDEDAENEEEISAAAKAYFSEMQLKQQQNADAMEEEIEAILEQDKLDDASKEKVASILQTLADTRKAQADCEALIKAKIGGEALVLLRTDGAEVIVDSGRLNAQTTLQITEILENNAAVSAENLTIMEAK